MIYLSVEYLLLRVAPTIAGMFRTITPVWVRGADKAHCPSGLQQIRIDAIIICIYSIDTLVGGILFQIKVASFLRERHELVDLIMIQRTDVSPRSGYVDEAAAFRSDRSLISVIFSGARRRCAGVRRTPWPQTNIPTQSPLCMLRLSAMYFVT